MDYEGHATQKEMVEKIQDIYDEYIGLVEDHKNITENWFLLTPVSVIVETGIFYFISVKSNPKNTPKNRKTQL